MHAQKFLRPDQAIDHRVEHAIEESRYGDITFVPFMITPGFCGQIEVHEDFVYEILNTTKDTYANQTGEDAFAPSVATTSINLLKPTEQGTLTEAEHPDEAHYMVVTASVIIGLDDLQHNPHDVSPAVDRVLNVARKQHEDDAARRAEHRKQQLKAQQQAVREDLQHYEKRIQELHRDYIDITKELGE